MQAFSGIVALVMLLASGEATPPRWSRERYRQDVQRLSSSAMQGRGVSTAGIVLASEYIAEQFKHVGLQPAFGSSYFQPFTAMVGARLGPASTLTIAGVTIPPEKFRVFGLSSPGAFTAPVVFAGYGISAPEYNYDDYKDLDVRGKAVLILRYEPQEENAASVFDGTAWSDYATFRYKIFNARRHGAAAVLLVTGPSVHAQTGDELVPLQSDPMAGLGFGLPMFHVARSTIEPILQREGLDLLAWQKAVDADLVPRSRPLSIKAWGKADLQRLSYTVRNVGGLLLGVDRTRTIIIGAHYDHLGFGGPYDVSGPTERIHFGADDNASGTAGLLELARYFAANDKPPPVNLLFLAFTAEESGLVGSTYFVQTTGTMSTRIVAMINLDMIGRLRHQTLTIYGAGTAAEFAALISSATPAGLNIVRKVEGFGPSDHTPFFMSGIPVLHFFTGSHDDYHKPSDTPDKINVAGAMTVVEMVAAVIERLAMQPHLRFVGPTKEPTILTAMDASVDKPGLGVVPDFASDVVGVRVASVRPGTLAAQQLMPGDVIVAVGRESVLNTYELMYHVRRWPVGKPLVLRVRRGGREAWVTLLPPDRVKASPTKSGHPREPGYP